jgi:hypothetical protein
MEPTVYPTVHPTVHLTPPRLSPGVRRGDGPPEVGAAGAGIEAAAVDCNKLKGVARQICYQAQPYHPVNPPTADGPRSLF